MAKGKPTLEELAAHLRADDPEERRRAVCDLPGGWMAGALELLVAALGDSDWRVRKEAVGRIVDWPDTDGAVAALMEILRGEDDVGSRNAAIEALSRIGEPAVPSLIKELAISASHRKFVVDVLGAIGTGDAVTVIAGLIDDQDPNLGIAAAEALRDIGGEQAIGELRRCLDSNNLQLRLAALDGLAILEARVPAREIAPALAELLLRKSGLRLLGCSHDPAAAAPLLEALGDSRGSIREVAAIGIAKLLLHLPESSASGLTSQLEELPVGAREQLQQQLRAGRSEVRRAAATLLGHAGAADAVAALAEQLVDPEMTEVCSQAIARLGPRTLEPLLAVAGAADPELRVEIFELIGGLELGGSAVETALVSALDQVEEVAAAAARALGALGQLADGEAVGGALGRALIRDDVDELAGSAATALGQLGRRGLVVARPALEQGLESEAAEVRAASALALAELGDPAVAPGLAAHLSDDDAYARLAAIRALATLGEVGCRLLRERMDHEDDAEMVEAIRAVLELARGGAAG